VPNTYTIFSLSSGSATNEFIIPFVFLSESDVKVKSTIVTPDSSVIPNNRVLNWTYTPYSSYATTIINGETNLPFGNYSVNFENGSYKIKFSKAVFQNGMSINYDVLIYRQTTILNSNYFTDGSVIRAKDLNNIILQNSYILEEIKEYNQLLDSFNLSSILNSKLDKTGGALTGNITTTGSIILSNNSQNISTPSITLNGGTISNLPSPSNSTDAVNKAYVDSLAVPGSPLTLTNDSVNDSHLRKVLGQEAVTSSTIRNNAVTESKLASNSISNVKLQDNSISDRCLQSSSITNLKLASNSVGTLNLINSSVSEEKLQNNAVTTNKLASNSVTNSVLASNSVSSANLQDNSVTASKIAVSSVDSNKLLNSPFRWSNGNSEIQGSNNTLTIQPSVVNAVNSTLNIKEISEQPILSAAQANNFFASGMGGEGYGQKKGLLLLSSSPKVIKTGQYVWTNQDGTPNASIRNKWLRHLAYSKVVAIPKDVTADAGGYATSFPYELAVKNAYENGEVGSVSIFAWRPVFNPLMPGATNYNQNLNDVTYNTITNIPFNAVIFNNNPSVTLNTATGVVGLDNYNYSADFTPLRVPKVFFISITGVVQTYGTSTGGHLFMKYPSHTFITNPPTIAPVETSVGYLYTPPGINSAQYQRHCFDFKSCFVQTDKISSFVVQYYYNHSTGFFNGGYPSYVKFGDSFASFNHTNLPPAWRNYRPDTGSESSSQYARYAVCMTLIEMSNVDPYNPLFT